MKTTIENITEMTLKEFADLHGLEMRVVERNLPVGDPDRFYAEFKSSEVKEGPVLVGTYGNGATPEEAIAAYKNELVVGTCLVIDAFKDTRKEIIVPRLK